MIFRNCQGLLLLVLLTCLTNSSTVHCYWFPLNKSILTITSYTQQQQLSMISCFLLLSHQFVDVSIQRQRLIFCKFLGLQEKPPVPDHCGRKKKKLMKQPATASWTLTKMCILGQPRHNGQRKHPVCQFFLSPQPHRGDTGVQDYVAHMVNLNHS